MKRLRRTGLDDETLRATTIDGEVWEARFGYVVLKKPSDQHGVMYDTLVNTIRAQIPSNVAVLDTKVIEVSTSDERQRVVLADGEEISARLIVLANGLSISLRHMLGLERRVVSECHSVTLGFDVVPVDRPALPFPALTYWPKRSADRMAYLTLFPIGNTMRANLMVYRPMDDIWFREFRKNPEATMRAMMPRSRPHGRRTSRWSDRSRSGRRICTSPKIIGRPELSWLETPSRHPVRPPAPAPTRCSPTSNVFATSTSRTGSRPKA